MEKGNCYVESQTSETGSETIYRFTNYPAYPNSRKVYVTGSREDIRVPMREITLADSLVGGTKESPVFEPNEPVRVYDTSGFYTDPEQPADIYAGLPKLRESWIEERGDTEQLIELSSQYSKQRLADGTLDELRFEQQARIRRAKPGKNVTQLHYARQGSSRPRWNLLPSAKIWAGRNTVMRC